VSHSLRVPVMCFVIALSPFDPVVVGHEIDLAPGLETVGVTSVARFRWTR
jgi:hypothetical protein